MPTYLFSVACTRICVLMYSYILVLFYSKLLESLRFVFYFGNSCNSTFKF